MVVRAAQDTYKALPRLSWLGGEGGWKPDGVECKRCGGNGVVIAI